MEIRQLKTFKTVADHLSFHKAADAINYAQSTVSAQIMALDEDLGIAPDQIPQLTEKLFEDQGQSLAGLIAKHQKPLVGFSFHSHEVLSIQKLRHHGIPVFPSLDRTACFSKLAVAALHNLFDFIRYHFLPFWGCLTNTINFRGTLRFAICMSYHNCDLTKC